MIGRKFYMWTVLDGPFKPEYGNNLAWLCRCECGYEGTVIGTNLRTGGSKGCGCLNTNRIMQVATKHGLSKTLEYALFTAAKSRARKNGIPFNLDLSDIVIPEFCPVLGIPMIKAIGKHTSNSPSLDKIIVKLGYVKGNVWVISNRANTIKTNATVEEIELLAAALRNKIGGNHVQALYQLAG